jgi:hypothetical protein
VTSEVSRRRRGRRTHRVGREAVRVERSGRLIDPSSSETNGKLTISSDRDCPDSF